MPHIDALMDAADQVSLDLHRHVTSPHSGKGRSKREASEHTNRADPAGHNRKTVTKLVNNNNKKKAS